ncbi:MAG: hypothetical protein ACR2QM_18755 [Longimicrobiales bacterium]
MSGTATEPRAMSTNLVELLLEVAIGIHRYGIYPSDHPTVIALGDRLARRVNAYTERQGPLTVGVADGQMLVGEAATDPTQPILRDFTRKARDRGIGGFTLLPELAAVDVELFLEVLAQEPTEDGLMPQVATERIRLLPPGYERLQLADPDAAVLDPSTVVNDMWLGLARSAISNGAIGNNDATDIDSLAKSVRTRVKDDGGSRLVLGYMAQIAGVLAEDELGDRVTTVRAQFTDLLNALDPATLRELLQKGGGNETNIQFAFDVCRSLDPATAVKVLEAIPKQEGRRISHQLVRLLRKMSIRERQAPAGRQRHAVDQFRDAVERVSREWDLDGSQDQGASRGLSDTGDLPFDVEEESEKEPLSTEMRIVWLSLETEAVGVSLRAAVETLVLSDELGALLRLVDAAPEDHEVAKFIRDQLSTEAVIGKLVRSEDVDLEVLESVIERMGLSAIEPLIEALISSPSRSVRRVAFDRLQQMGMPAGLSAVTQLENQPWYVLRNLLALSQCLETIPAGVDPLPLLFHEDVRVRRDAFPVCLKVADGRTPALKAALVDPDERIVKMALAELRDDLPGFLVPDVLRHVDDGGNLGRHALNALAESRSPLALKALLDLCVGKRLLRGMRMNKKSPTMLAALRALRDHWSNVDEASSVLTQASRSKDADIRAAARGDS